MTASFRVRRLVVVDADVLLNSLFKEGLPPQLLWEFRWNSFQPSVPHGGHALQRKAHIWSQMQVGILRTNYFHPNWNESDESVFPPELSMPEAGEPASGLSCSLLPTGVDLKGTLNSGLETASCGFQTDPRFHFYWMIRLTVGLGFEMGGKVMTWWFFYDCCRSQSHQENSWESVLWQHTAAKGE